MRGSHRANDARCSDEGAWRRFQRESGRPDLIFNRLDKSGDKRIS